MRDDIYGAHIDLPDSNALTHWNGVLSGFLAHSASVPDDLSKLLQAAPESVGAHALKGLFCVLLGRRELTETAREEMRIAKRLVGEGCGGSRERALVDALEHWLNGDPVAAIAHIEAILDTAPHDTLAMKLSHAIRFMLGDAAGMLRSVQRVLPAHGADHPGRGYVMGCEAFALEETGHYAAAESAGRAGLALAEDDAWGLHAVAHVHDMTGRSRDGIDLLLAHEGRWSHCNNFRYHVWWHKALLHLDLNEIADVLGLYDDLIRADKTDDYRDIANGTSLLMRLELEGVDVGTRWEELADLAETRIDDGCVVFADLHYMLALIGDKRQDAAARLVGRLADNQDATSQDGAGAIAVGASASAGLAAFGEGQYEAAFSALSNVYKDMPRIGGSHAQRDIFERMTIDAGIRAGRFANAGDLLAARRNRRGGHDDRFSATRMDMIELAHFSKEGSPKSRRIAG